MRKNTYLERRLEDMDEKYRQRAQAAVVRMLKEEAERQYIELDWDTLTAGIENAAIGPGPTRVWAEAEELT